MNLVFYKLSSEIRTFTLVQFLGAIIGSISALYFYIQGRVVSSEYYFAALWASVLTLLIIGLCDFFIHRNAAYLKTGDFSTSMGEGLPVRVYENAKATHWSTKIVVPVAMLTFGNVQVFIFSSSYFRYASTADEKVFYPAFMGVAIALFCSGAFLGKIGWKKNEK